MKDKKELLKEELKKRGFNNKRVSVRKICWKFDCVFTVIVKDENISILEIEDICKKFDDDNDEHTLIAVRRPWDKPLDGSEYREIVQKALSELKSNCCVKLVNGWEIGCPSSEKYVIFNLECCKLNSKIGKTSYLSEIDFNTNVTNISRILKERELAFEYLKRKNK